MITLCEFHIFAVKLHGFFFTNHHNDQLSISLLAQLVEHYTGIAGVVG